MARSPRRARTASRLAAVQALFQSEQAQDNAETVIDQFVRHRLGELPGTGGFEEGRVGEADFETHLGRLLGLASHEGLIDRLFSGAALEESMVGAVRAARRAGIATGLISNSWGTTRYPRELLGELFDGVVISGEVGMRKPAARIYELGAEAIARDPAECVFVDDLPFNLPPAVELGMATVHHTAAESTIAELEQLLGMTLS